MRTRLAGRTVVITGGSRGLGLELARQAMDRGARVVICGRDEHILQDAQRELEARGDVLAVVADVASPEDCGRLVVSARKRFREIDVVIANAGVIEVGPIQAQNRRDFEEAMSVMYWGVVNPVLAVLPAMREAHTGSIAVVTSIGGRVAMPHLLPYVGAKFAATGFAEGLRAEVAADGVAVTVVVPGLMRTGSSFNAVFKGDAQGEHSWFSLAASMPLLSVSVVRAARQILDGVERQRPQVVVGAAAQVATRVHGMAPVLTMRLLSVVDRLLPDQDTRTRRLGRDSETPLTGSAATLLNRRAARSHNQERRPQSVRHQPVAE